MIKIQPDKQKAAALKTMAEITLDRLKDTNTIGYPTNTLTDYYDIIRKLMESLTSLDGIKIKGEGAHQRIIEYICKRYNLGEKIRHLIQELRTYRNRISYEGFMIKANYVKQNQKEIEEIINKLFELVRKRLK